MIPFWLYAVATLAATALFAGAVGYCLGSAQGRVDRILAEELYHPLVNDQEASDRAAREGSDG